MTTDSTRPSRTRSGIGCALGLALLAGFGGCEMQIDPAERLARGAAALAGDDGAAAIIDAKAVLAEQPDNLEARLLLADASFVTGDLDAAAFEYERASELGAPPSRIVLNWGQALLGSGRFAELLGTIGVTDDLTPDAANQVRLLRATAAHLSGDTTTARSIYADVLVSDADNEQASVGVAATHRTDGETAEARRQVDALLAAHPDWTLARMLSAELFRDEGLPNETIALLEDILADDGSALTDEMRLRGTAGLVAARLAIGDAAGAEVALADLTATAPEAFATRFLTAETRLMRGDLNAALATVEPLLTLAPRDVDVLSLSARIRLQQGALSQAETHLVRAFAEAPERTDIRRLLAEVRLIEGRAEDAESLIAPLLEAASPDPGLLQLALRITVAAGNPDQGIAAYQAALDRNPSDPDLRFGLAASQLLLGNVAAAEATLANMDDDASANWRRPLLQALTALRRGDSTTALADVERIVQRWPDTAAVQRAAGIIAEAADRPQLAAERYDRVLALAPDREQAYLDLARVRSNAVSADAAREVIERGLGTLPDSVALMMAMAGLEAVHGSSPDESVRWLARARDADPDAFAPRLALAEHYRAAGEFEAAIGFAREAVQLEPFNPVALHTVGLIELARNNTDSAIEALSDVVERRPGAIAFRHTLARAQLAGGEPDAALRTLAAIDAPTYDTELLQGFATAATGRTDAALAIGERLKGEYPAASGPFELMGQIAMASGDFASAADSLSQAYDINPSSEILERATFARLRAGTDNADTLIQERLEAEPDAVDLRRNYAHMLAGSGRADEAVGHYREVLRAVPDDLASLNNLAWIYSSQGSPEALTLARRAVDVAPDNPQANDTLGWILVEQGELIEGTSRLRHALQQGAQDPEIRYHLAVALHRSGDIRGAESQLVRALEVTGPFGSRAAANELLTTIRGQ